MHNAHSTSQSALEWDGWSGVEWDGAESRTSHTGELEAFTEERTRPIAQARFDPSHT